MQNDCLQVLWIKKTNRNTNNKNNNGQHDTLSLPKAHPCPVMMFMFQACSYRFRVMFYSPKLFFHTCMYVFITCIYVRILVRLLPIVLTGRNRVCFCLPDGCWMDLHLLRKKWLIIHFHKAYSSLEEASCRLTSEIH